MKGSILSHRYAEALADVAEKDGALARVAKELKALAEALSVSPGFRTLVKTAEKSRHEKRAALRRLSDAVNLCAHTGRLLEYLAEKRRTPLLPQLAESFAEEADRRLGIRRAVLISAVPLSDRQRAGIIEKLEASCEAQVEAEEIVDDSLIAGFQVRLDGQFFDGSLRGELERKRETIAHGG